MLTSPHGQNSVVELDVAGGDKLTVMVRDYAYHPVTRSLLHVDFMQVKLDQPVDVEVPFLCTARKRPRGSSPAASSSRSSAASRSAPCPR